MKRLHCAIVAALLAYLTVVVWADTTNVVDNCTEVTADTDLINHDPDTGAGVGDWAEGEDTAGTNTIDAEASPDECHPAANGTSQRIIYVITPDVNYATADYSIQWALKNEAAGSDDPQFVVLRWADSSNYYACLLYQAAAAADVKIFEKVAGVVTQLATGDTNPVVDTDVFKCSVNGTSIKMYKNDVEILSATDSDLSATGKAGIGFGNALVSTDDVATAERMDAITITEPTAGTGGPQRLLTLGVGD